MLLWITGLWLYCSCLHGLWLDGCVSTYVASRACATENCCAIVLVIDYDGRPAFTMLSIFLVNQGYLFGMILSYLATLSGFCVFPFFDSDFPLRCGGLRRFLFCFSIQGPLACPCLGYILLLHA